MVKINFISDFNNKLIKEEVENFKKLLSHLYGDFVNNNVNYNDYKGENMHINVYFYYINNCFMEKSTNNIFIYNTTYFSNNWKNKLNKFLAMSPKICYNELTASIFCAEKMHGLPII